MIWVESANAGFSRAIPALPNSGPLPSFYAALDSAAQFNEEITSTNHPSLFSFLQKKKILEMCRILAIASYSFIRYITIAPRIRPEGAVVGGANANKLPL